MLSVVVLMLVLVGYPGILILPCISCLFCNHMRYEIMCIYTTVYICVYITYLYVMHILCCVL